MQFGELPARLGEGVCELLHSDVVERLLRTSRLSGWPTLARISARE